MGLGSVSGQLLQLSSVEGLCQIVSFPFSIIRQLTRKNKVNNNEQNY